MVGKAQGRIVVGVGGWTFEPWRETFYPPGLPQKRELEYASGKLTSIEINGTYYGAQKRESFAKWRAETPDGFVFSVKGTRYATNRRALAESASSVERFLASGVAELKEKLGPINWQFMATKKFDAKDFEDFLKLLPKSVEGLAIRHVVEVRHESFRSPDFIALLRAYGVGVVYTDSEEFPEIADITADFVYARLMRAREDEESGYSGKALDRWAANARVWAKGGAPEGFESVTKGEGKGPRDVFIYMINGFKPKAPAAAMALIERLAG
ncbi:MAG TPA: DUF72 domain-containing protein [Roseiarcus sp.]|jgi:uncharacterized protein YecE (DUF72 family)